jgi:uncharacterized membrane protein
MNYLGVIALLTAIILGSLAQVLLKKGGSLINQLSFNWQSLVVLIKEILTNFNILGWVALGALSALFWIVAIAKLELSFAVPVGLSLGIILTTLLASWIIGEEISLINWLGIILIALGIFLLSYK